jgi:hypothetical protein
MSFTTSLALIVLLAAMVGSPCWNSAAPVSRRKALRPCHRQGSLSFTVRLGHLDWASEKTA